MFMIFLSGTKGWVFRLLCFYKLSRYFSVRILHNKNVPEEVIF